MIWLLVVGVVCLVAASLIVGAVWLRADHENLGTEVEEVPFETLMGSQNGKHL